MTKVALVVPSARDADFALLEALMTNPDDNISATVWETKVENASQFTPDMFYRSLILDGANFHAVVGGEEAWFRNDMSWLVQDDGNLDLPDALRLDSNFYTSQASEHGFTIHELYRVKSNYFHEKHLGDFLLENGGELDREIPFIWERRKNLHGIQLVAGTLPWPVITNPQEDGSFTGYLPDCLSEMQHRSNFSLSWTIPPDGSYGAPVDDNRTWNGLIGMLQEKKIDLAVGLAETFERNQVVSFVTAVDQAKSTLVIVHPKYLGRSSVIDSTSFLKSFTLKSWVGLLIMFTSLCVTYLTFFAQMPKDNKSVLSGLGSALAFGYKSFLKLSVERDFKCYSLASRVLFFVSVLYPIVISAHFEAVLTSFMTVVTPTKLMSSSGDVPEFGYRLVTLANSKLSLELETAPPGSGWHKAYQETMKGRSNAFLSGGLAALAAAALSDPARVAIYGSQHFFLSEPKLIPLTDLADAKADMWALATLQKDSELRDLINYNMIRLHSSGLLDFMKHKWIDHREPNDACGPRSQEEAWALGFSNLFFPMAILCSGIAAALGSGMMEYLYKGISKRQTYILQ